MSISIKPDRKVINADGKDLCFIEISMKTSAQDNLREPLEMFVHLNGDARIADIEQAISHRYISNARSARFHLIDRVNIVLQAGHLPRVITLTARIPAISTASVLIKQIKTSGEHRREKT